MKTREIVLNRNSCKFLIFNKLKLTVQSIILCIVVRLINAAPQSLTPTSIAFVKFHLCLCVVHCNKLWGGIITEHNIQKPHIGGLLRLLSILKFDV